jgi:serine/threonine-protein kinase RsbW
MRGWTASEGEQLLSAMCSLAKLTFRRQEIPAVRRFAAAFGVRTGMAGGQLTDFVLAVSEAAASALSPGPGTARLRLWSTGARVLCEVHAEGTLSASGPRAIEQGDAETLRRWLLKRLCDHVSFEPGPSGVTVRFSVTVV